MTWRILISAPYFLPVVEQYRSQLEAEGLELIIADVNERLSEEELLSVVPAIHGAICGDDQFTEPSSSPAFEGDFKMGHRH